MLGNLKLILFAICLLSCFLPLAGKLTITAYCNAFSGLDLGEFLCQSTASAKLKRVTWIECSTTGFLD